MIQILAQSFVPQSLLLMVVGMLVVFLFLILLSLIVAGSSRVTPKLSYMMPDPVPAAPKKAAAPKAAGQAEVAVAILAALKRAGK